MSVGDLVRQANEAVAIEAENAAAREAADAALERMRAAETSPPQPPGRPESRPGWLRDAERLAGSLMTPDEQRRRQEAAERAEAESARVESERRRQRIEESASALPALYSYELGQAVDLGRFVTRAGAIFETDRALQARAPSLVWVGGSGSGKTTLACAAAREWARAHGGGRIVFARATEIATASRYHALGAGQPEAIGKAIRADLLILDELGPPQRSAQWQDVEDVVFARYEQNRPTWVTTWLTPEIPTGGDLRADTASAVAAHYGGGFARRILERATVIDCGGR